MTDKISQAAEELALTLARRYGGWNEDTSETSAHDPELRAMLEAHWEKVNAHILDECRQTVHAILQAGWIPEKALKYEYAVRDESPTSWYGDLYAVGVTEEMARYLASGRGHNDTAMRRLKGPWEELT